MLASRLTKQPKRATTREAILKKAPYGALMMLYFAAPMRQMVVPQSGHLPLVMGLPFLVTPSTGSFMIFFALHLTQYASIAILNLSSFNIGVVVPTIGERLRRCSRGRTAL